MPLLRASHLCANQRDCREMAGQATAVTCGGASLAASNLSKAGTERTMVDSTANHKQPVGAAPSPAHLLRCGIRQFNTKLAVPSVSPVSTRSPARCRPP